MECWRPWCSWFWRIASVVDRLLEQSLWQLTCQFHRCWVVSKGKVSCLCYCFSRRVEGIWRCGRVLIHRKAQSVARIYLSYDRISSPEWFDQHQNDHSYPQFYTRSPSLSHFIWTSLLQSRNHLYFWWDFSDSWKSSYSYLLSITSAMSFDSACFRYKDRWYPAKEPNLVVRFFRISFPWRYWGVTSSHRIPQSYAVFWPALIFHWLQP